MTSALVSLEAALVAIGAARELADELGIALGIAVVDSAGALVACQRMDGAQPVAVPLALEKAYTSAAIGFPTRTWSDATRPDGDAWGSNSALGGRIVAVRGGLPIRAEGALVGAIGVSAAAADSDEDARTGVAAVEKLMGERP